MYLPTDVIRAIASKCNERTSNNLLSTSKIYLQYRYNYLLRDERDRILIKSKKFDRNDIEYMVKNDCINIIKIIVDKIFKNNCINDRKKVMYGNLVYFTAKYYYTGLLRYLSKNTEHTKLSRFAYCGAIAGNHETLITYYKEQYPNVNGFLKRFIVYSAIDSQCINLLEYYIGNNIIDKAMIRYCFRCYNYNALTFLLSKVDSQSLYIFALQEAKHHKVEFLINYFKELGIE